MVVVVDFERAFHAKGSGGSVVLLHGIAAWQPKQERLVMTVVYIR
ncbi:MAG: hypothetical protein ACLUDU_07370 [Butyricimonas faecihominis]